MKNKISLLERFVYFFDLRAYERRITKEASKQEVRIRLLEDMLVDLSDPSISNADMVIRAELIRQKIGFIKAKREREDLSRAFLNTSK